jgi:hypothetical protein
LEEFGFHLAVLVSHCHYLDRAKYVKDLWKEIKYPGYQVSNKYLLGNVASTITPKGINAVKDVGLVLPHYIANYKGGRNEYFM